MSDEFNEEGMSDEERELLRRLEEAAEKLNDALGSGSAGLPPGVMAQELCCADEDMAKALKELAEANPEAVKKYAEACALGDERFMDFGHLNEAMAEFMEWASRNPMVMDVMRGMYPHPLSLAQ